MPLVRIELDRSVPADRGAIIVDAVHEAMHTVAGVPEDDRFQVITHHDRGKIVYPTNGYLGIRYSPGLVIIQITWNAGRSVDVKKRFYRMVAESVAKRALISERDVFINIVEVARENWSFGNGDMQYGQKDEGK